MHLSSLMVSFLNCFSDVALDYYEAGTSSSFWGQHQIFCRLGQGDNREQKKRTTGQFLEYIAFIDTEYEKKYAAYGRYN